MCFFLFLGQKPLRMNSNENHARRVLRKDKITLSSENRKNAVWISIFDKNVDFPKIALFIITLHKKAGASFSKVTFDKHATMLSIYRTVM